MHGRAQHIDELKMHGRAQHIDELKMHGRAQHIDELKMHGRAKHTDILKMHTWAQRTDKTQHKPPCMVDNISVAIQGGFYFACGREAARACGLETLH